MGRACIIGAGSAGIASYQVLHARGIPFDCFELGSAVGGNWRYNNDNGLSSAYRALRANSSRRAMQYAAFPIPDSYPNYLSHRRAEAARVVLHRARPADRGDHADSRDPVGAGSRPASGPRDTATAAADEPRDRPGIAR